MPEYVFQKNRLKLLESYGDTIAGNLPPDAEKYVLAGARELLNELSQKDHIIALYTGNSRRIVDAVLKATDLGGCFRFCLYDTEAAIRIEMVRQAIEQAR